MLPSERVLNPTCNLPSGGYLLISQLLIKNNIDVLIALFTQGDVILLDASTSDIFLIRYSRAVKITIIFRTAESCIQTHGMMFETGFS